MSQENFRTYCPGCEPEADSTKEILSLFYCVEHAPTTSGAMDHVVDQTQYLSGGNEVEAESNRAWCAFFHRNRK